MLIAVAVTIVLSLTSALPTDISESLSSDIALPSPLAETLRRLQTDNAAVRDLSDTALSPMVPRFERRDALVQLGDMYFYGNSSLDTSVNGTLAMSIYAEAAALGAPRAQFHVGVALSYGLWGFPLDEAAAMVNYYFAALGGDISATMVLGHNHLLGISAPKKCETAVRYYELAANEAVARREANVHRPAIYDAPHRRLKTVAETQHKKKLPDDSAIADYYQFSADKGDPDATISLATLYFYGERGVSQDVERAALLYKKAYDLGATDAAYHLGHCYSLGIGVPQNNATAFKYMQEAVNEGNAAAQNELAHMYLHGKGTKRDEEQAVTLFKAAMKQGSVEALYNLGVLYMRGGGLFDPTVLAQTHPEYDVAYGYFLIAAYQGHTISKHKIGQMSLHGIGTTRSCTNAVETFKLVAERGEWDRVLTQAYTDFKQKEYEAAFMKYAVMAQQGYEVAQHNAAYMLDAGFLNPSAFSPTLSLTPIGTELTTDVLASTAVMLYRLAAQQGNVDANLKIGDYYYYGKGGHAVNYVKASAHYFLASKHSNAQAMFNLALMYEHGIGMEQDFNLAKRFFDKARLAHSDAKVPVMLATWKLRAHKTLRSWKRWWDNLIGNVSPSATISSESTSASTEGDSNGLDADASSMLLENWWLGDLMQGMITSVTTKLFKLQSEDFVIAILMIALGIVLYIRSERQYLPAPPLQQQ
ncbi:Extracellular protein SEL-1 and related proteins [Plasmopara halstedii]|uniref:Extracellular protein SEL-1 and related proteins n=1 Tax=Plasmopara halstedii TaxID=4781 RepID=A0A0P1B8R5_PLAHL|nr:Extracellular protein SEL-1 and related proteins [Plasmopara halstedii]CEG50349.1 Extracellular protein SEL-1 and related proteins [Plasmopara halstedii]|eukprot:XP_024586718.1 Extracellular protein SEL-1 and related proteins [Plasmopara halstedii]